MELTATSNTFKVFILVLGFGGFLCMYMSERQLFPPLAKWVGKASMKWRGKQKKRKEYKLILEDLRI